MQNQFQYGEYGGQFVPEGLKIALNELNDAFERYKDDQDFHEELNHYLKNYVGRESPLYHAQHLSKALGGAQIFLKREDLNHTGAHKINNTLGQILLAKRMGKKRIIAETGAGQHGVATATAAALFGMECIIYQGALDMERQKLNVFRMELLGAEVKGVERGTKTLKDAVDVAIEDWVENLEDTFYLLGSAVGPHPFPSMVRHFQSIIGKETATQFKAYYDKDPDMLIACVGGGSNAIGLFAHFLDNNANSHIVGVEAAGKGVDTNQHAATITKGKAGVIHGMNTIALFNSDESISDVYSISAGLDYPGVGPEHAFLHDTNRVEYTAVTDDEAVEAFQYLSKVEGIIPAIETSHAIAEVIKRAPYMDPDKTIVVNLSGRGDKDVESIKDYLNK